MRIDEGIEEFVLSRDICASHDIARYADELHSMGVDEEECRVLEDIGSCNDGKKTAYLIQRITSEMESAKDMSEYIGKMTFRSLSNKELEIIRCEPEIDDVIIPKYVRFGKKLKKVVSIGAYAFRGNRTRSVSVPDSVRSIGKFAFADSFADSIVIPYSVSDIGCGAFITVKNVEIDGGNINFVSLNGSVYDSSMSVLIHVPADAAYYELPKSVTEIQKYALCRCTALCHVYGMSGRNLLKIGDYAFSGCSSMKTITLLSESLEHIGVGAFENCTALKKISFEHTKADTIRPYTFSGCTSLIKVSFRMSNVAHIEGYAFSGCTALTSVKLSPSVRTVHSHAFEGCSNMKMVFSQYGASISDEAFPDDTEIRFHAPGEVNLHDICNYRSSDGGIIPVHISLRLYEDGRHWFNDLENMHRHSFGSNSTSRELYEKISALDMESWKNVHSDNKVKDCFEMQIDHSTGGNSPTEYRFCCYSEDIPQMIRSVMDDIFILAVRDGLMIGRDRIISIPNDIAIGSHLDSNVIFCLYRAINGERRQAQYVSVDRSDTVRICCYDSEQVMQPSPLVTHYGECGQGTECTTFSERRTYCNTSEITEKIRRMDRSEWFRIGEQCLADGGWFSFIVDDCEFAFSRDDIPDGFRDVMCDMFRLLRSIGFDPHAQVWNNRIFHVNDERTEWSDKNLYRDKLKIPGHCNEPMDILDRMKKVASYAANRNNIGKMWLMSKNIRDGNLYCDDDALQIFISPDDDWIQSRYSDIRYDICEKTGCFIDLRVYSSVEDCKRVEGEEMTVIYGGDE